MTTQRGIPRSQLRTYTLTREGHFDAAHRLPNYPGKCATLHGHTWRVMAQIEFPIIPVELVSHEDPDVCGILVDYHDIDELWAEWDHCYLNDTIENPTAEVLANILLEALCDLVEDSMGGHNLPFEATIHVWESCLPPESCATATIYQPSEMPVPTEREWMEGDEQEHAPWTEALRESLERDGLLS